MGGETSIAISSITDTYTFIGFPGQSYKVTFETGGGMGTSNGTLTVDYMPELVQAINDPFVLSSQVIPTAFYEAIPKLLPTARVTVTENGGLIPFTTTLGFYFPRGLRPWFDTGDGVYQVLMLVKFIGGISLPWPGVISSSVVVTKYNNGVSTGIGISDTEIRQTSSGFWPAFVIYFGVEDELLPGDPTLINVIINHGASTVVPNGSSTLGYFIVRGND